KVVLREIVGRACQVFGLYRLEVLDRDFEALALFECAEQDAANFGSAPFQRAEAAQDIGRHPVDDFERHLNGNRFARNFPDIVRQARNHRASAGKAAHRFFSAYRSPAAETSYLSRGNSWFCGRFSLTSKAFSPQARRFR